MAALNPYSQSARPAVAQKTNDLYRSTRYDWGTHTRVGSFESAEDRTQKDVRSRNQRMGVEWLAPSGRYVPSVTEALENQNNPDSAANRRAKAAAAAPAQTQPTGPLQQLGTTYGKRRLGD